MAEQELDEVGLFSSVSLASFLAADDRPTLVFDLSAGQVAFTNPAFVRLRESAVKDHGNPDITVDSLLEWASGSTTSNPVYLGHTWTHFTIEERWQVVTCIFQSKEIFRPDGNEASALNSPFTIAGHHVSKRPKMSAQDQQDNERHVESLKRKIDSSSISGPSSSSWNWMRESVHHVSPYVDLFFKHDWSQTPLGPMEFWPIELKNATVSMLNTPDPRLLLWGDQLTFLYNDACVPIIGIKHPQALGQAPSAVFAELWSDIEPVVTAAIRDGRTTKVDQMPITIERAGFSEETYFQFIMQPVLGPDGQPVAAADHFTEITNVVVAERRMNALLKVGDKTAASESLPEVWKGFLEALETDIDDIPFAALYCLDNLDIDPHDNVTGDISPSQWSCSLQGSVGLDADSSEIPNRLDLAADNDPMMQCIRLCWKLSRPVLMDTNNATLATTFIQAALARTPGIAYSQAVACPISSATSTNCLGFLLLGISPRRPYDEEYQHFVRLLNDRLIYSAASVTLPKEYRQIQASAEETALRYTALSKKLLIRTEKAEEMEAKFTRMAAASPVGCYLLRVDGTPIYLNDAYYRITGLEKPTQLSFGADSIWREQVIPEDIPKIEKCWFDMVEGKRPSMVEYRLKREWKAFDSATEIEMRGPTWLLVSAFPELDDKGEVQTIIGWVNDISLQKWTENLQTRRLAEALEAKRQSERFIDVVSHEMRNPLSAIYQSADNVLASLQELQSQKAPSNKPTGLEDFVNTAIESAQTIVLCAQHQKRIVDDILTLSKLDADLMALCPESVHPIELTRKALKMYEAELENAEIEAQIVVDKSYYDHHVTSVLLDPSRLLQVLINLLTNAIKFTKDRPRRRINITVRASSNIPVSNPSVSYIPRRVSRPEVLFTQDWGMGSELYLLFAVQDTGQGLEDEEVKSLFVRFAQANPRTNVQYGGSGLGLFISKELTELQGGQIGVSSVSGEGSTFQFYVKARRDVKESRQPTEGSLLNILDSAEPLKFPEASAEGTISRRQSYATGAEASGIEGNVLVPTIGQPAPIPVSKYASSPETKNHIRAAQDLHVLVVEDNVINQKVMVAGLRKLGCVVHIANNGLEAIHFLQRSTFVGQNVVSQSSSRKDGNSRNNSNSSLVPLSLILMDLEMPVMDGLTCIREIREMQKTGELIRHVPVAAVTANARMEQLNTALEHGMDVVITKPFRIPELLPKMHQMVEGERVANSNPVFSHVTRPGQGN